MSRSIRATLSALEPEDALVLATVIALPWAFGGVAPWAQRSASALLVVGFAVAWLRGLRSDGRAIARTRWLAPAVLLGAWAAFQLVPLPDGVVRLVSPRAAEIHRMTYPDQAGVPDGPIRERIERLALDQVDELRDRRLPPESTPPTWVPAGRWSGWRPLSLLPEAGWERLHWYVALLLAFVVVHARCAEAEVAAAYRRLLFGGFLGLAVVGLVHAATAEGTVYWLHRTIESSRPFGPYVNPSHFAGVMELAVPWLAGAAADAWKGARRGGFAASTAPLLVAAAALCLVAGLATASKAAPALLGTALCALGLVLGRSRRVRLAAVVALIVVAIAVPAARFLPVGERVEELLATSGADPRQIDRVVAWGAALPMFGDFAVSGCGYGAFGDVFPAYLPTGEHLRWEQLHNDYLEAAIAGGIPGTLLLAWMIGAYGRRAAAALGRARRRADGATVGLIIGLATLSVHAFFDFNHQIPANGLLFVVLAAIAVARADARRSSA